jgi:septal ring factor EnvC (AmiA/AmiB activator)
MKEGVVILIFIFILQNLTGQTRKDLEDQRKKTLEEITYVDNLLKETTKEKSTGLDQIKIIGNKLNLRENVISGMREEINLLTQRIDLNTIAIEMMDRDLILMKRDYAKTIVNSYKSRKGNPEIGFILSSRDFNQGYKRLRYLQQVTKFRHQETEIIVELQQQIEKSKLKLQDDLDNISDLKSREESQKKLLQQEQDRKKRIVQTFSNKEKQLRRDLEEKKKLAQKIEAEIARIIEEERKKKVSTELTPEQKLIGENFADNKGRLPWPVEKGIITSQFGVQQHPVLANVTENNIGIEISCSGKTVARSVFKGQVMRVFPISGENIAIMIRHGKYLSVYLNLVNPRVKQGDNVDVKQAIGDVFWDKDNGSKSVLKFMIFEEKYLDPETFVTKYRLIQYKQ